ncbi:hypothetical protein VB738_07905 [Cyanobium gracile UHCC 0139]|uniref:Uncharacterized protein n=1 Tax=Cyanobium gracile UHCC 0139 TaxID=3110308 RepID=A0ABU5RTQ7_9CYAN|nr:hypothetical protein [Cyanobium gracile]MEA5391184.1 hypothetical protein [Cyanobium gracile UHCC 0139]
MDVRQPYLPKVRDALAAKKIEGFFSMTMLTIEGIMRTDRADVFASTRVSSPPETYSVTKNEDLPEVIRASIGDADIETIKQRFVAEQPSRRQLHPEVVARVDAARALGVRALKDVPRVGAFTMTDPAGEIYLSNGEGDDLLTWQQRAHDVARTIEARGLGIAQVIALGTAMTAADPDKAWFSALADAKDIHEQRAVERAFGEWADGDAIASHVAYGIDVFCSADVGNSNAANSVLDPGNRAWLTATCGVRFMTFEDLLAYLP